MVNEELEFTVDSITDVTRALERVRDIEDKILEIKQQRQEHEKWFRERIESQEKQKDFWLSQLEGYLDRNGGESISLPSGRVYFRKSWKDHWPEEEVLVTFCRSKGIPLRMKTAPDKRAISDYIKETGDTPPGYSRTRETNVVVST